LDNIEEAFSEGMFQLCKLHAITGVGDTGEYLDPAVDRQVGLGILGLANFLSIHGVSYEDFGKALEAFLYDVSAWTEYWCSTMAGEAVWALASGIDAAAEVARQYKMERAFCIAPTASCSYRYLDSKGFTTTPEIAPPIGRIVDRDSGTFGVEQFNYGEVEIAEEVGWETFKKVANGVVSLYQASGLFHGYSYNSWNDVVVYDRAFLKDWLESPQTSLYYSLQVLTGTQAKDDIGVDLKESLTSFFGLENEKSDTESHSVEPGFCTSCAE
jgi:hypothetical protein